MLGLSPFKGTSIFFWGGGGHITDVEKLSEIPDYFLTHCLLVPLSEKE